MFRKKVTQEEFIDFLLDTRYEIESLIIKSFKEDFDYSGEEKGLIFEARIFSLWIIMLSLPPVNDKLKDDLHNKLCDNLKVDNDLRRYFFKEIDKRYKKYFDAFNMWQKDHKSGHMLGGFIVALIKNQDSDFLLTGKLPRAGDTESLKAFMLFGNLFETTIKTLGEIKKKYNPDFLTCKN